MNIRSAQVTGAIDLLIQSFAKVKLVAQLLKGLSALPSPLRHIILLAIDGLIFTAAIYSALSLRFEGGIPSQSIENYTYNIVLVVGIKLCIFQLAGMYRPLLRYSGLELLEVALKVTIIGDGTFIVVNSLLNREGLPRSVQVISALVTLFLVVSSRLLIRRIIYQTDRLPRYTTQDSLNQSITIQPNSPTKRVIIYGAGHAGFLLSQALEFDKSYEIIAFVDDAPHLYGREVNRIKIYRSSDLRTLITRKKVHLILLAIPSAKPKQRQQILRRLKQLTVEVKTVPTLEEIVSGKVSIAQIRQVDIADLLGREEVLPDLQLLKANITGKSVLVTGAGGSIGSELCRQIAQQAPKALILYEINEYALYSIELELAEHYPQLRCIAYLGSVTDAQQLGTILTQHRVETVYHTAAYKHVPLVEANPIQGVHNNTYGTLVAAQTADRCGVKTFVLISTDKAVRPTNIMGASKRVAELVLQALAGQLETTTRFIIVRFGNVLDSSGSVVPRFRQQIAEGKSITLTHPEITRYFMSIPEAARLVIQAGALGRGGEVFLLDMGDPIKIYDLAVQMIELSGLVPGEDVEIDITGLRPGEKLYEELLIEGDNIEATRHPRIYSAQERMIDWQDLEPLLFHLFTAADKRDVLDLVNLLTQLVPEYAPQSHHYSKLVSAAWS